MRPPLAPRRRSALRHQHLRRRRRPRQRLRLLGRALRRARRRALDGAAATPCSPSATPATTTSAGTAADSTRGSTSWARCGSPRGPTASRTTSRPADAWLDQVARALVARQARRGPSRALVPRRRSRRPPRSAAAASFGCPLPLRAQAAPRRLGSPATGCSACPARAKEVRQFTFDTRGRPLTYEAGDALGVLAGQLPRARRANGSSVDRTGRGSRRRR